MPELSDKTERKPPRGHYELVLSALSKLESHGSAGLPITRLTWQTGILSPDLKRILRRLELQGLVVRRSGDAFDEYQVTTRPPKELFKITAKGREILQAARIQYLALYGDTAAFDGRNPTT